NCVDHVELVLERVGNARRFADEQEVVRELPGIRRRTRCDSMSRQELCARLTRSHGVSPDEVPVQIARLALAQHEKWLQRLLDFGVSLEPEHEAPHPLR